MESWQHENYEIDESGLKVLLMCYFILQCHYSYSASWQHENYQIDESGLKVLLMCYVILQCHYSYSACGLGSDGTDRLVRLVQEMQHGKPSKSEGGTLYGAKITGGGSGGTVCVIGRNCLRSSQQILEVILDQHDHRKMLIFLLYAFVPFIIVHMFLLFFEVANYK